MLNHCFQQIQLNFLLFLSFLMKKVKKTKQKYTQPAITCSNLTIETLEKGVKYVQS